MTSSYPSTYLVRPLDTDQILGTFSSLQSALDFIRTATLPPADIEIWKVTQELVVVV